MLAHRRDLVPLPRLQPVGLHQSDDALPADRLVLVAQVFVNARAAVPLPAGVERRTDQHRQPTVIPGPLRFRTPSPGVVATRRHLQTPAQDGDRIGIVLFSAGARMMGARLPSGLHRGDLLLVGIVAAIGFTVSLFFATAALPEGPALAETKMGALLSFVAAPIALLMSRLLRVRAPYDDDHRAML